MNYDPSQPTDLILNSIDELVKYALADKPELNQSQTINPALVILHEQRIFKDDIRECKSTNPAYKTWDNFKHKFQEDHLDFRETGRTIDKLGFHNINAIVDQIMARLQIDEDERTSNASQHATKLASTNQTNATMVPQMQNILSQVHALQLANTHKNQTNHGKFLDADAVTDVDVAPIGEPNADVDADDHQLRPLQNIVGLTGIACTGAKNVLTLLTDTGRMQPLRT